MLEEILLAKRPFELDDLQRRQQDADRAMVRSLEFEEWAEIHCQKQKR